jgi:ABC-2 type transport system permease protein
MWERILRVILRKEFIQALREPRMRVLLFLPPIMQLIVFGYAVNLDVDHARIAWMDMDRTPESRSLRDRFTGSGRFDVVSPPATKRTCSARSTAARRRPWCASCRASRATWRAGAHRSAGAGGRHQLQHGVAGGELRGQIIAEYSATPWERQQRVKVLTRSPGSPVNAWVPQVTARSRVWFNPDLTAATTSCPA